MIMNTKSTIGIAVGFLLAIAFLATAPVVLAVESNNSSTGSWYVAANRGNSQPANTQIAFASVPATAKSRSTSTPSSRLDAGGTGILAAGGFTSQTGTDLFVDITEYATALDGVRLAGTSDLTAEYDPANATSNFAGSNDNLIGSPTGGFRDMPFYRTPASFLFLSALMLAGITGLWFRGRRRKRMVRVRRVRAKTVRVRRVKAIF